MYAVDRYVSVNDYGTAVLFQQLIDNPVRRVVVASSMSIYGEGLYRDRRRRPRRGCRARRRGPIRRIRGTRVDAQGRPLVPVPTPEWKRPALASVYALGKYVQERLTLTLSPAYGMEGVALRLWNVYGPGQALSNPYTGVLAIFASRLHNGKPPMIFEDGHQRRDFVHVEDVADAFVLALEHPKAAGEVYNIGQRRRPLRARGGGVARERHGPRPTSGPRSPARRAPATSGTASPTSPKPAQELGFAPQRDFAQGLAELAEWVARQEAEDRVARGPQGARAAGARGMTAASAPARPALVGRRPVLVTGGAGFIGSNLADRLAREGHDVLVYDALARPGVEGNLAWLKSRHPQRISSRRSATSATSAASPPRRGTPRRCSTSRRRSR